MHRDPKSKASSHSSRCALALMVKAPIAGAVKTRLTPPLTPQEAATLSTCVLRDMSMSMASLNTPGAKGVVLYTPADAGMLLRDLLPACFELVAQGGESVGGG